MGGAKTHSLTQASAAPHRSPAGASKPLKFYHWYVECSTSCGAVDVLEETVEDDEEDAGKSKGQKKQGRRQKRKR